ncbi:hypothetical protein [Kitasatospora sp. NPDC008115]|uniref:hypothetical protein n=1 Tax=Kitasatospora sp. NPDC008115 TaxID=3364022 RepID=UPI0036E7F5E0
MPGSKTEAYGKLQIGDTPVRLKVTSQTQGFIRQSGTAEKVRFSDLSGWVKSQWQKDLPDILKDVTIGFLSVTIETSGEGASQQRTFAFEAVIDFTLGQTPAQLFLGVTHSTVGNATRVSARLRLTGTDSAMTLEGTFEQDTVRGWGVSVTWQAAEGEGLTAANVCDALGVKPPDELPAELLDKVMLSSVRLQYWPQDGELVCAATVGLGADGTAKAGGAGASFVFASVSA